jgi:hypothetical protein
MKRMISIVFTLGLTSWLGPIAAAQDLDPLQTDVLSSFEMLEGEWHMDYSQLPEDARAAQAEQGVSGNHVTFAYGTDRQWMEFGDYQTLNGTVRHTGAGLIAFSPQDQHVTFLEHGARGASVMGTLEMVSESVFERSIVVARTDRSWRQVDRWEFDADGACFTWTSRFARNGATSDGEPRRWCRAVSE